MQKPQQVWQGLAAELGAIDIAMQGAYKVFSCMDEEEVKVQLADNRCTLKVHGGSSCPACRVSP